MVTHTLPPHKRYDLLEVTLHPLCSTPYFSRFRPSSTIRAMAKPRPSLTMWLPKDFNKPGISESIFVDASHRGDMYHIRAVMCLAETLPLILHSCDQGTGQLEEYLDCSRLEPSRLVVRTSLSYQDLIDHDKPRSGVMKLNGADYNVQGLVQRSIHPVSEGDTTRRIADQIPKAHDDLLVWRTKLRNYMFQQTQAFLEPPNDQQKIANLTKLSADLDNIMTKGKVDEQMFNPRKQADPNRVMILHRDSGSAGGPYPELDSGGAETSKQGSALIQMARIIMEHPSNTAKQAIIPHFCGDVAAQKDGDKKYSSTGPYWKLLDALWVSEYKNHNISARDFQVYFMWHAFERGHFSMVVGMRSGLLDSFTFMGIPTVSIGLAALVGETRHQRLAKNELQRVNAAYLQPRHSLTEWAKEESDKHSGYVMRSPWWAQKNNRNGGLEEAERKKALTDASLQPFAWYDLHLVRAAIWSAIDRYVLSNQSSSFSIIPASKRSETEPQSQSGTQSQPQSAKDKGKQPQVSSEPLTENLIDYQTGMRCCPSTWYRTPQRFRPGPVKAGVKDSEKFSRKSEFFGALYDPMFKQDKDNREEHFSTVYKRIGTATIAGTGSSSKAGSSSATGPGAVTGSKAYDEGAKKYETNYITNVDRQLTNARNQSQRATQ